jgi:Tol biopolymer transport system component
MNASLNPLVHPQPTSLYLVSAEGSRVRKIASGYYVATAWSPDGTQIAAIEYSGSRRLVVMDADGTGKRVLVELPADELFTGLAWHPLPDN